MAGDIEAKAIAKGWLRPRPWWRVIDPSPDGPASTTWFFAFPLSCVRDDDWFEAAEWMVDRMKMKGFASSWDLTLQLPESVEFPVEASEAFARGFRSACGSTLVDRTRGVQGAKAIVGTTKQERFVFLEPLVQSRDEVVRLRAVKRLKAHLSEERPTGSAVPLYAARERWWRENYPELWERVQRRHGLIE